MPQTTAGRPQFECKEYMLLLCSATNMGPELLADITQYCRQTAHVSQRPRLPLFTRGMRWRCMGGLACWSGNRFREPHHGKRCISREFDELTNIHKSQETRTQTSIIQQAMTLRRADLPVHGHPRPQHKQLNSAGHEGQSKADNEVDKQGKHRRTSILTNWPCK